MITFLFTAVILLGFIALALYYWQKPSKAKLKASDLKTNALPHSRLRGLFGVGSSNANLIEQIDSGPSPDLYRTELLERAKNGDHKVLQAASEKGNKAFYNEVLNSLLENANSGAQLLALVSYVARHELPVNQQLAKAVIESWKEAPDRRSTAKTLHIVALSDDAILYQAVVEAALQFWRDGVLTDISQAEIRALFDGEFWLLSSNARGTGAGFVLKRTLAHARRELENAARVNE